jgi:hypothetical protein
MSSHKLQKKQQNFDGKYVCFNHAKLIRIEKLLFQIWEKNVPCVLSTSNMQNDHFEGRILLMIKFCDENVLKPINLKN